MVICLCMFTGFVLTLVSALLWSSSDTLRKLLSIRIGSLELVLLLAFAQSLFFLPATFLGPIQSPNPSYILPAIVSILLNSFANLFFILAVKRAGLGVTVPLLSLSPAFSALGGYLILGETLNSNQMTGLAVILFGLGFLIPWRKLNDNKETLFAQLLMIVVSLFWSIAPIFDKQCLQFVAAPMHATLQAFGILIFFIAVLFVQKPKFNLLDNLRQHFRLVFSTSGLTFLAISVQLFAIQYLPIGLFEAVKRASGLIFILLLGRLFLQEPIAWNKIVAVLFCSIGLIFTLS